ncbi:energy transducer TonB [Thiobacillus sp.]
MPTRKRSLRSRLPLIGGLAFMALFTAAVVWMVMGFINSDTPKRPRVQIISLVKPPPPKPPEEKPPEPEKIEKPKDEVKIDEPQPTPPEEAPPPPAGGIPDGPEGGMATDLAAGSGIGIGGGGAGGDRRAWYSRMISRELEDELKRAKRLHGKDYRVVAQIWFNPAGAVSRVLFDQGTGDSELDEALRQEIMQVNLRDPLPDDIPQPVRLRMVSR